MEVGCRRRSSREKEKGEAKPLRDTKMQCKSSDEQCNAAFTLTSR
jgi:hypothetical protein